MRRDALTADRLAIAEIVAACALPDSRYGINREMNDPPTSEWLEPRPPPPELRLVYGLADPVETRPAKSDNPPRAPRGNGGTALK
jgi:hypothetical protein